MCKGDIITIPCMFVSKVKSGYLVMIPSEKNNRPVIYPDSVIYKLEKK